MEKHTILQKNDYMYDGYDFDSTNIKDVNNKLFCTFTGLEDLDTLISDLTKAYTIMYNKMFVLYVKSTDEYVVTYNVEQGNVEGIPMNTVPVTPRPPAIATAAEVLEVAFRELPNVYCTDNVVA